MQGILSLLVLTLHLLYETTLHAGTACRHNFCRLLADELPFDICGLCEALLEPDFDAKRYALLEALFILS